MKALLAGLAVLIVAGCATIDPYATAPIREHLARSDEVGDCARLFREADLSVERAGVRDAMAARVPGFPYLRVDRLIESLGDQAMALPAGFMPWSELMGRSDREARAIESENAGAAGPPVVALDACRYRLAIADAARLSELRAAAHVPDDYSITLRALGLYPLTRIPFASGIRKWHEQTRTIFAAADVAVPGGAARLRYAPAAVDSLPDVAWSMVFNLPQRSAAQWRELLLRNAPRLAVETATDDDRIGHLVWGRSDGQMRVDVDTGSAVAYARVAFARLGGRIVPQLVYAFWFPARPATGVVDPLAGALDGIVWRVTLDADFEPVLYDSIHPCGCYHLFFPTERVRARAQPDSLDEGMFAPQAIKAPGVSERLLLRVESRTHYLQHIDVEREAASSSAVPYAIENEDVLRHLPLPAESIRTRSVYGPDGLIPGSERAERFFFWPMGIASAGQMRQWGRHATAFVGRRHFDDPLLIDRYFELAR
jgi:hypothetical protein